MIMVRVTVGLGLRVSSYCSYLVSIHTLVHRGHLFMDLQDEIHKASWQKCTLQFYEYDHGSWIMDTWIHGSK